MYWKSLISDDLKAWNFTNRIGFTAAKRQRKISNELHVKSDTAGPRNIDNDIINTRRWTLLAGSQFLTYPHRDAAGLCTWTALGCGEKIWCYLMPKIVPTTSEEASKLWLRLSQIIDHINNAPEDDLPDFANFYVFFLKPGTLLLVIVIFYHRAVD